MDQFFLKSVLNLLQYCFCSVFCLFGREASGILVPQAGIEPAPSVLEEASTTGPPGRSPKCPLMFWNTNPFSLLLLNRLRGVQAWILWRKKMCHLKIITQMISSCKLSRPRGLKKNLWLLPSCLKNLDRASSTGAQLLPGVICSEHGLVWSSGSSCLCRATKYLSTSHLLFHLPVNCLPRPFKSQTNTLNILNCR